MNVMQWLPPKIVRCKNPIPEMCALCNCEFARMRHAFGVHVRLCDSCVVEVDEIVACDATPARWREGWLPVAMVN